MRKRDGIDSDAAGNVGTSLRVGRGVLYMWMSVYRYALRECPGSVCGMRVRAASVSTVQSCMVWCVYQCARVCARAWRVSGMRVPLRQTTVQEGVRRSGNTRSK